MLALLMLCAPAGAADWLHRWMDPGDGLGADLVHVVQWAKDDRTIWLGGPSGLTAASPRGLDRADPAEVHERVDRIAVCGSEVAGGPTTVWAIRGGRAMWRTDGVRAVRVPGPEGEPVDDADDVACAPGGVWVAIRGRLWRFTDRWEDHTPQGLEGGGLVLNSTGPVLAIGTERGAGWVRDGRWEQLLPTPAVMGVWTDGVELAAIGREGMVQRWRAGEVQTLVTLHTGGWDVVGRNGSLWASWDEHLGVIRPDGRVELCDARTGAGGTDLEIGPDQELWLATSRGVLVYPEPDTRLVRHLDGLPDDGVRFLVEAHGDVWAATWRGLGRIRPHDPTVGPLNLPSVWSGRVDETRLAAGDLRVSSLGGPVVRGRPCLDDAGTLWVTGVGLPHEPARAPVGFGRWDTRRGELSWSYLDHPGEWTWVCTPEPGGSVAWWTTQGRYRAWRDGRVEGPFGPRWPEEVFGAGTLPGGDMLLVTGRRFCLVPAAPLDAEPVCEPMPDDALGYDVYVEPDGVVWVPTFGDGVLLRHPDGTWETAIAAEALSSGEVLDVSPSPRGGVWVAGAGVRARYVRGPGGVERVESLGAWHGVSGVGAAQVLEQGDGTVWVATAHGLWSVPPHVRGATPSPPGLRVLDLRVHGEARAPRGVVEVEADRNDWQVTLAATTLRDPSLLRFRARLSQGPWSQPAPSPTFVFNDLPAGRWRFDAQASLDGEAWSSLEAPIEVEVLPFWYEETRWRLAIGAAVLAAAWGLHRMRLRAALALEAQRLEIAMDLHDELGAGLGSVGILSGLAAEQELPPEVQRNIAADIASTASTLGRSLSDIVWSLRPTSMSLAALGARLREEVGRLAPAGAAVEGKVLWEVADQPVSPQTCRAVHRIAVEAVYNAIRHSGATHVEVRLREAGRSLVLEVEDDGVGMPDGGPTRRGLGLDSMTRRARSIGGELSWERAAERGTVVRLRFGSLRR